MSKVILNNFELSDIKRIIEEVLEKKLKHLNKPTNQKGAKMLSRKETANLLRIPLPTLHHWTKNGLIKAYRIGNRVLYKQDDVSDALNLIITHKSYLKC